MFERKTMSPELQLLFASARCELAEGDEAQIRLVLDGGIDWTAFAELATGYGLAGVAGRTLARVVPEAVPADILEAFRLNVDLTRDRNRKLLHELHRVLACLEGKNIVAIPIKGVVTAIEAYGDLGLRAFRDLEILVQPADIVRAVAALEGLGYESKEHLSEAQTAHLQWLRGQIQLSPTAADGVPLKVHTRLTSAKMVFDVDYSGLWQRAQRKSLNGQPLTMLAPEDYFLVLAVNGGKDLWWRVPSICDVAAFVGAHPKLDWNAIVARAESQGCLRMATATASLAHMFFDTPMPPAIATRDWPAMQRIAQGVAATWSGDEKVERPRDVIVSRDHLDLHDGVVRQARYLARAVLLPKPSHVTWIALPRGLSFGYVPLKLVYEFVWLPLAGLYRRLKHWLAQPQIASFFSAKLRAERRVYKKARAEALRAIDANSSDSAAWYALGNALHGLERYEEAIACFDKGLALVPDNSNIWRNRSNAIAAIKKKNGSCGIPEMPPLDPKDANSLALRASYLWISRRYGEAIEVADQARKVNPEHTAAERVAIASRIYTCDWRFREADKERVRKPLKAGKRLIAPFGHRSVVDSEEDHLLLVNLRAKECPASRQLWRGERYAHEKIRIAYISPDFRGHVVGRVVVDCLERHDKARFETIAISLGRDDASSTRKRLEGAFDRFVDAQNITDSAAARLLRELEVDIAVDLAGYTQGARNNILAVRPAPVQVNWLGYPGTLGTSFMDYIIADHSLIPPEHHIHYTEKVVYLPQSYLPHDSKRGIPEIKQTRTDAGLPESGFVFACFNDTHKITPEVFDIWMRLLHAVEGSVLWLRSANAGAMVNLRREAEARGVSAERLIYARHLKQHEDYLARLGLADLFLDTVPYNAHATGIDALWAGLPILTRTGNTFAGRVATGLLQSIGMPELVTSSPAEYEQLALAIARDPQRLARIKAKLLRNRETEPLFDMARFTRNLEKAYTMMWERTQRGEPPVSFAVPAD